MITIENTTTKLLARAKWAFSTRRVQPTDAIALSDSYARARPGDLVLGRVLSINSHRNIQLTTGRRSELFPDDLVVLACGARYAADQFEGIAEISASGSDMLAGGGCIGKMVTRNERIKPPTRIEPLGLILRQDGKCMNLNDYALSEAEGYASLPTICVVGAGMNAGKTTATASLIYGLRQAGWRVAGLKGTGTGAYGDYNAYVDAGAAYVGDFTDTGMVSTYCEPKSRIVSGINRLLLEAETRACDVAVLEIADGIVQQETAELLSDPAMRARMAGFIYASGEALSAIGGVQTLRGLGIRPAALTGMISCSPLAAAEATRATGIEVITKSGLSDPAVASGLFNGMMAAQPKVLAG